MPEPNTMLEQANSSPEDPEDWVSRLLELDAGQALPLDDLLDSDFLNSDEQSCARQGVAHASVQDPVPAPGSGNAAATLHDFDDLDLPSLEDIVLRHEAADSTISGMHEPTPATCDKDRSQPGLEWPTPTQALGFCHPALLDDAEPAQPYDQMLDDLAVLENPSERQRLQQHQTATDRVSCNAEQQQDYMFKQLQQAAQSASTSQQASNQQELASAPPSPQLLSVPDFIQSVSNQQALAFSTPQGSTSLQSIKPQQPAFGSDDTGLQQTSQAAELPAVKSSPPASPLADSGDLSAAEAIPMGRKPSPELVSALKAGRKRARPRASEAANKSQVAAIKGQGAGGFGVQLQPEPQPSQLADDGAHVVSSNPGSSNCSGNSNKTYNPGQPEEDDAKREERMQRNRESAHQSRQRKKMQVEELSQRCDGLQQQNTYLSGMVTQLTAENAALRHQLAGVGQAPAVPPAPAGMPSPPGSYPPPLFAYPAPLGRPAIPGMLFPQPPMFPGAVVPKVAIQKLKPSRPAPAPSSNPSRAGSRAAAAGGPARKRLKQTGAAGTALLAISACFLFLGPFGMAPISSPTFHPPGLGLGLDVLPGQGIAQDAGLSRAGRVLTAADVLNPSNSSLADIANADSSYQLVPVEGFNGSAWMLRDGDHENATIYLRPHDEAAQSLALERLKELGPVAVVNDWDNQATSRILGPSWQSFPSLAGAVMGGEGLLAPVSCSEAFSFEASTLAGGPGRMRQQLQQHLATLASFKGRSSGNGALALPPIGGLQDDTDGEPEVSSKRQRLSPQPIGCDVEEGGVVVSVMLPTRQDLGASEPSLTNGYHQEQEALLRRSCCVLIEAAGQKLKVKQLVLSTAAQYLHRYFLVKSFATTDRMVLSAACLHLACTSEDTPVRVSEVSRAVHDVFYNFSRIGREQMLSSDYTQKLHEALVKAERALCYVLGFNLEPFDSYTDLYKLIKPYQLSSNCEDVPQMAWDFLILSGQTTVSIRYDSRSVAVAAGVLARCFLGQSQCISGPRPWWSGLINPAILQEICTELMDAYKRKSPGRDKTFCHMQMMVWQQTSNSQPNNSLKQPEPTRNERDKPDFTLAGLIRLLSSQLWSSKAAYRPACRCVYLSLTCKAESGFRPTLDDVDRISRGKAAKSRGTGSRNVPHRLNADERKIYELAHKKGFLVTRGSGYRKERKGSPLANIFRQWCDAQARACIIVLQASGSSIIDTVLVDLSTLRSANLTPLVDRYQEAAAEAGCRAVPLDLARIPFTIHLNDDADAETALADLPTTAEDLGQQTKHSSEACPEVLAEAEEAAEKQAQAVRALKDSGRGNQDPKVQAEVKSLLKAKERVEELQAQLGIYDNEADQPEAKEPPPVPIWQLPVQPLFFEGDVNQAKSLAKIVADSLQDWTGQ
ncbi:hypothetical protein WJX74_002645 [Apatococcus lobatus]|uniref:BZIP domain-containing protein n=1 Tax=Apatococcus lobatus TaxID=904363 RepID=A0AAW1REK3_9CHLO